jgi:hypothetical protein
MSEYHKIETLYERDEMRHRLKPEMILKNRVYGLIKSWVWTEKIDGTNIRAIWKPAYDVIGETSKALTFGGKTDNATMHTDLLRWLQEHITPNKMRSVFPEMEVVLYGEGYGAGIQKGGGLYSATKQFILFDVFVVDTVNSALGGWWLSDENMRDVASKLGIDAVPLIGEMTLEEAGSMIRIGFPSRLNGGQARAEGMVGRPAEALFDKKGHRLIVKLKTKDF